ncbi:uncharacterized protein LOC125740513 isoform X2 [Brienomyrus brachyistius]|uniref:uncharacterized protein LOC125740513 isoform X2 n=1 Tax=Brienomyrus brachyistius TaxID=42636 RepID=UPI0020B38BD4|nr:uncharacterized protein LOC125740513 isoform X2 [Brienomyrus brachyistius]
MAAITLGLLCLLCASSYKSALGTTKTIYGAVSESAWLRHGSPLLNPTQIQWHRNGTILIFYNHPGDLTYPQKNKFQLSKTDGTLQIFNLSVNDTGNYKVTLINTSYQTIEEIKLIVVEKIKKPKLKVLNATDCFVKVSCVTFNNHSVEAECNIPSDASKCPETKKSSSPDLYIFVEGESISCVCSIFASSNSSSIAIKDYCSNKGTHHTNCVFLVALILVALLF